MEEANKIKNIVVEYYKGIMDSSEHVVDGNLANQVKGLLKTSISEDQATVMDKAVTGEEIKMSNKAHGPDGFSAGFFKAAWHVVGKDVVSAIN